ncbi:hypothetical protein VNO77_25610 [Canavalia gladiata]|uniref:Uncharacterized protein n=1 Tax=Canavalia gladiata TaxID=3824 RepID=A0AAN9LAX3_CANGL
MWVIILGGIANFQSSATVNIGAVLTLNLVMGRAAKKAMEMAIPDINEDPKPSLGSASQALKKGVAAIVGPQSSAITHIFRNAHGLQKDVITIFLDDDFGRNGIGVLGDEIGKKGLIIAYKIT